jgi:hypothetical protein
MSQIVYSQGDATVAVGAGESIAVASIAEAQVFELVGFPNYPVQQDLLGLPSNNEIVVYGPFTNAATIQIQAGATVVLYNVGTAPSIPELIGVRSGVSANALNTTAAATSAAMIAGITDGLITTTTAAAVTLQLPTGAAMDAAMELAVGDSFTWTVVNTGPDTATVTNAGSGHNINGDGAVVTATSGSFLTVKTAADTFASYRM